MHSIEEFTAGEKATRIHGELCEPIIMSQSVKPMQLRRHSVWNSAGGVGRGTMASMTATTTFIP